MERLAKSCVRLTLPAAPPAELQAAIVQLVRTDLDWVPAGRGFSLYLRPTVIATQTSLGVGPSDSSLLFTIMSPVGPYFASGFKPISLHANTQFVRSWHGGVGDAKCGGNYAPTILPQRLAAGVLLNYLAPLPHYIIGHPVFNRPRVCCFPQLRAAPKCCGCWASRKL
jgi:branched-chain amino acid aminotransferase